MKRTFEENSTDRKMAIRAPKKVTNYFRAHRKRTAGVHKKYVQRTYSSPLHH